MYTTKVLSRTVTYDNFPSVTNTRTIQVGKSATSTKVENWKQKILSGGNATSNRDATEVKFNAGSYSAKVAVRSNPLDWEAVTSNMGYDTSYSLDHPQEGELLNSATLKWYQEVGSDMNLYTTLGELTEAIRMIKKPAMGLRKLVDAQSSRAWSLRTSYSRLQEYRKAASDLWLEFAFGWRPLIQDINGYYSVLTKNDVPLRKIMHAVSTATADSRSSSTAQWTDELYATVFKRVAESQNRRSYRISGSYTIHGNWNAGEYDLGSTPADLIPAAWELMPWSFLIDYFSTVGKVLNAHVTASKIGITFASGTYRRADVITQTITPSYDPGYPAMFGVYMNPGIGTLDLKVIKRRPLQLTIPQVSVDKQLSFGQGLNILALIGSRRADLSYKP